MATSSPIFTPLGSKFVVRILIIAGGEPELSPAAAGVRAAFSNAGHVVQTAAVDTWQQAVREPLPEVVLLDLNSIGEQQDAPDFRALARLSRQLREAEEIRDVPLVVIAEPADDGEEDNLPWSELWAAGVDDVLNASLARAEIASRIDLLARFGKLRHELAAAREQLARHTQLDEATQLMTRRFFFQAAHRECSRSRRYHHSLACLMLDVDYFDRITKNFSTACGDHVLRSISYIVRQWTRDSDILGRFSGSKIVILLPETTLEGAAAAREKIHRAVAEGHFDWQGESLPVTVSIGEATRSWQQRDANDTPAGDATAQADAVAQARDAATRDAIERGLSSRESEPLSVREELAELLADADAALHVAKKSALCPPVFVEYALEPEGTL